MDPQTELALLRTENNALKAALATVEAAQNDTLLVRLLEYIPTLLYIKDPNGRHIYLSRYYEHIIGLKPEDVIGKTDAEAGTSAGDAARYAAEDADVLASHQPVFSRFETEFNGQRYTFASSKFGVYDRAARPLAIAGFAVDVSREVALSQERQAMQDQLIATQDSLLRELSTPLIPLSEGVILMPLIGSVDARRAQQIMEVLLEGIALHQADTALLDISGVRMVDTQVADALIRTANAAHLLGAHVILTGISADVAQTIVQLGAHLAGITTYASLREALAEVLT